MREPITKPWLTMWGVGHVQGSFSFLTMGSTYYKEEALCPHCFPSLVREGGIIEGERKTRGLWWRVGGVELINPEYLTSSSIAVRG